MGAYIQQMKARATESHGVLFRDISELLYADFPDYGNVGDSAIALGQMAYFRAAGVEVREAFSYLSIDPRRAAESRLPVIINGGGNIGGMYPLLDQHRYGLIEAIGGRSLVIQAPQSLSFCTTDASANFARHFGPDSQTRFAARDEPSVLKAASLGVASVLATDAVHFLGKIAPSRVAIAPYVELVRGDAESALRDSSTSAVPRADWIRDSIVPRWRVRATRRLVPLGFRRIARSDVQIWSSRAGQRLARGVEFLSRGEFVVTDRLHAMLIGLQMGKHVIAMDNTTRKLSSYAETWFKDLNVPLEFAGSYEEARDLARMRVRAIR